MTEYKKPNFHMEAAGSLTPELEGAPASGAHGLPARMKGGENGHAIHQEVPSPAVRPREKER